MQRIIIFLVIIGFMVSTGLSAQKVYLKDGRVILDMTVAAGMPAMSRTDELKTPSYDSFTPNDDEIGTIGGDPNDAKHPLNKTVYQKLEISPNTTSGFLTWVNAFNYCKDLIENEKDDWRLPTQRELQVMWIFKEALDAVIQDIGGTPHGNHIYWSANRNSNQYPWHVKFESGESFMTLAGYYVPSSNGGRPRCVREVVD